MVKQIAGIPTYVINGHQEAYHLWRTLGVKERTLVHVDAHHDLWGGVEKKQDGSYTPHCGNYLLPAIRQRMINEVWWINPFSVSQYCINPVSEKNIPKTRLQLGSQGTLVDWGRDDFLYFLGLPISQEFSCPSLRDKKYILDIDLDAFSCCASIPSIHYPQKISKLINSKKGTIFNKKYLVSAEEDYSPRISRVLETLSNLSRPEMIVIAKSQGKGRDVFISPKFVSPVKKELVRGLEEIFSQ